MIIPDVVPSLIYLPCAGIAGFAVAAACGRATAVKTSAVILACCSMLVGADTAWRLLAAKSLYYRPDEMFLNHWPPMSTLTRYQAGAQYSATTYGDLGAMSINPKWHEYRAISFRSDAYGFPNPGISPEPASVILLGDSFGAGTGTTQSKTWASLLGSRYHVPVYNLSIPATGPWHELMDLKIELPRIKRRDPAVLLWAIFSGNDLDDQAEDGMEPVLARNRLSRMRVSVSSFLNRSPIRRVCQSALVVLGGGHHPPIARPLPGGRSMLFRKWYAENMQRTLNDIQSHENYPRLIRVFHEMAGFALRERVTVAVVMLPSKEEVYNWILRSKPFAEADAEPSAFSYVIRGLSEANGFQFMDLKPPLIAEARRLLPSGQLLWWTDDTHWNERGHAFAAETVYTGLLRRLLEKSSGQRD
jgi:hypothetical protein